MASEMGAEYALSCTSRVRKTVDFRRWLVNVNLNPHVSSLRRSLAKSFNV